MKRFTTSIALIALTLGLAGPAFAQAPSEKDLAAAKAAFKEGAALQAKGKFDLAISKYKDAYKLSKKPVMLYNIAQVWELAGDDELALSNYRKFLAEAAADDASRAPAEARVVELEKKLGTTKPLPTNPDPTKPDPTKPDPSKPDPSKPVVIKPAGTYSATDFKHAVVMEAPPTKALDITAFVPEDSGWTVTLFYRGAGDTKFYTKPMKWRYTELVGRVPAAKVAGTSIQYYIEVKDQAGAVVTRSGKSTSPNLVGIEITAPPRFYPDFTDEGTAVAATPTETKRQDNEEDPLTGRKAPPPVETPIGPPSGGTEEPTDNFVGSSKFKYAKWGTTIGAATFIGLSLVFYVQAGNFANALAEDSNDCGSGTPPCKPYDDYAQGLQSTGERYQLMSRVAVGLGVATAGVAGYLWYRGMKARKSGGSSASAPAGAPAPTAPAHDELSWIVAPAVGDGYAGASALMRF